MVQAIYNVTTCVCIRRAVGRTFNINILKRQLPWSHGRSLRTSKWGTLPYI